MLHCRRFLVVLFVVALSQTTARADFVTTVTPSIGPNPNASLPSFTAYYQAALNALSGGQLFPSTPNSPGTPGYYAPLSGTKVPIASITTTQFPSYNGSAPGTGAYSGEYGGALFFGLKITGSTGVNTGTAFTLASLSYSGTVTDPQQNLGYLIGAGGYALSNKIYVLTSPTSTTYVSSETLANTSVPIYGLVYVGSYDSLNGSYYNPIPGDPGATTQQILAYNLAQAGFYNYTYAQNYTYSGGSGGAVLEIQGLPEPASITLLGVGALGLMLRRRFTRAKAA